jgi:hypothetical protein
VPHNGLCYPARMGGRARDAGEASRFEGGVREPFRLVGERIDRPSVDLG